MAQHHRRPVFGCPNIPVACSVPVAVGLLASLFLSSSLNWEGNYKRRRRRRRDPSDASLFRRAPAPCLFVLLAVFVAHRSSLTDSDIVDCCSPVLL
ncbi:hypothetical protein U9M48_008155 [Paspalum notatum var. saurae]|uniref:Uncharacterized protein n=1 Tax=Paspalum notatum var. saurae TaxID=547442 RepID=A0AAQ3SP96_PASNO